MSAFFRVFRESFLLLVLTGGLAYGAYLFFGSVNQPITCHPTEIRAGQVCLKTVLDDWEGNTLWVDARPRLRWETTTVQGAVLLTDDPKENWDDLLAESFERLATADQVVVFCAKRGCNASETVARLIRETGLAEEVYVLYGGWPALKQGEVKMTVAKSAN